MATPPPPPRENPYPGLIEYVVLEGTELQQLRFIRCLDAAARRWEREEARADADEAVTEVTDR